MLKLFGCAFLNILQILDRFPQTPSYKNLFHLKSQRFKSLFKTAKFTETSDYTIIMELNYQM